MESNTHETMDENSEQAEFFMSGLKQIIESENDMNVLLQGKVDKLETEKELLLKNNNLLLSRIKELELELKLKNTMLKRLNICSNIDCINQAQEVIKKTRNNQISNLLSEKNDDVNTLVETNNGLVDIKMEPGESPDINTLNQTEVSSNTSHDQSGVVEGSSGSTAVATNNLDECFSQASNSRQLLENDTATSTYSNCLIETSDIEIMDLEPECIDSNEIIPVKACIRLFDIQKENESFSINDVSSNNLDNPNDLDESVVQASINMKSQQNVVTTRSRSKKKSIVDDETSSSDQTNRTENSSINHSEASCDDSSNEEVEHDPDFFEQSNNSVTSENNLKTTTQLAIKRKEKKYSCKHCNKKYHHKKGLKIHVFTKHDKNNPFKCKKCGKYYQSQSDLDRHSRTHSGVKPYKCAKCRKSFNERSKLTRHLATHSSKRPFKCPVCPDDRRFKTRNCLNLHMVRHFEPEHECELCGNKFYTASDLGKHVKRHNDPTYGCKSCGKKFHTSDGLQRHERTLGH